MKIPFWSAVLALCVLSLWVSAATPVTADQGAPGKQGPWPVTITGTTGVDGGVQTASAHGACTSTTMNVGTSGIPCPGDGGAGSLARADRTSLMIQLIQSGETLTVTEDGTGTSASATNGIAVGSSGAFTDNLNGATLASCRCTAATCSVRVLECP